MQLRCPAEYLRTAATEAWVLEVVPAWIFAGDAAPVPESAGSVLVILCMVAL